VTSARRSPTLPELPTVAEAALPGFEATTWHGIVVPVKAADAVVKRINADLNAVLTSSDTRERLLAQGIEPRAGTPADFATYLKSEIPKWSQVVRDSGARAE
jgi:tripartite-type tricarboxylate transporter receptor subunit TctC